MSDAAAPAPAPAAAPAAAPASAPAAAPDNRTLTVPSNFAAFRAELDAQRKAAQPPPKAATPPQQQPRLAEDPPANDQNSMAQPGVPAEAPPEGDLAEDLVDPNAPPPLAAAPEEQAARDAADLSKFRALTKGELAPEEAFEMLKGVMVPMKNGDHVDYETLEEVAKSGMRLRDYHRNFQQWGEKEQRYQQHIQAYETHFQQIDDPNTGGDALYEVYSRRGNRKQMKDMALKLAQEEQEDIDHANGYAIAVARRHGIQDVNDYRVQKAYADALADREARRVEQDRMRGVEFQNQRLQQAQEQRQQQNLVEETAARINKQLDQLRPRAFQAVGVLDNPKNEGLFRDFLSAILKKTGAPKITPEICLEAARCTRDEILDSRKAANGGRQAPPQQRPGFRPSVGATGGGQMRGNQPPEGVTPESIGKRFGLKSWQ